ncbi:MAG: DUF1127 domain-containing protein [Dongiaceae bacterium]
MSAFFLIDPRFEPYRARAGQARAETLSRLAYLAVDRGDSATRALYRAVSSLARTIAARFDLWRERRVALQALSRLDDRMLRDIGLGRDEIHGAVYGSSVKTRPESEATELAPPVVRHQPASPEITWRKAA